jgi:hypothetical protein
MEKYLNDERVEALAFDYLHFYGNKNTIAWSPGWYRSEVRIIRNTIPAWSSEALFFNVVASHKKSRQPRAAHTGATIYHYGWLKTEQQINMRKQSVAKYWSQSRRSPVVYAEIDPQILRLFPGTHPKVVQSWLPPADGLFQASLNHKLTTREKKHRLMLQLERWLGFRFNKKHYRLVR